MLCNNKPLRDFKDSVFFRPPLPCHARDCLKLFLMTGQKRAPCGEVLRLFPISPCEIFQGRAGLLSDARRDAPSAEGRSRSDLPQLVGRAVFAPGSILPMQDKARRAGAG